MEAWLGSFTKKKFNGKLKSQHLQTLTDLLVNGFPLPEALEVMLRSQHFDQERLATFHQRLTEGAQLADCFTNFGFTPQETAQVELAQHHGNLIATFQNIAQQMELTNKQRQEMVKTLAYPVLLLLFIAGLLVGMRQFLLPQLLATGMMDPKHWGIRFLVAAPYWLAGIVGGGLVLGVLLKLRLQSLSAIQKSSLWSRLPIVGMLYRMLASSYFALEWGKLFQEGLELRQIIATMGQTNPRSLMHQLAAELDRGLQQGHSLADQLARYRFLTPEFSLIVFQGEAKGRLGAELVLYSRLTQKRFYQKVEKMLHLLQPLIFLFVALLIVSVYAAMFLPLYGNLNEIM